MRVRFYKSGARRDYTIIPPLTGTIVSYAGSSAPQGWLLCDGTAVSQTTYANLYAVIGANTFGTDSGGNFILPDFRGRIPMGAGTGTGNRNDTNGPLTGTGQITGGSAMTTRTIGQQVGSLGVSLTAAQSGFPTHNHAVTENNHGSSAVSPQSSASHPITADGNHRHQYGASLTVGFKSGSSPVNYFPEQPYNNVGAGSPYNTTNQNPPGSSGSNTYTIGYSSSNITDGSGNANVVGFKSVNAVGAHPNVQPSLVLNYIIKA